MDVVKFRLSKSKPLIHDFNSHSANLKITEVGSDAKKEGIFSIVHLAKRFLLGTTDKVIVKTVAVAKLQPSHTQ